MPTPDFNPSDGWPDEPGNERLREFAQRLADTRPRLAPEALEQIGQTVQAEIGRAEVRPQTKQTLQRLAAVAIAASVLVAVGVWIVSQRNAAENGERTTAVESALPPPVVEERHRVAFVTASASTVPSGPLVRLDDYQSLIEEVR